MSNLTFTHLAPPSATGAIPRVDSGQFAGDVLTMDTTGLGNVTAQRWIDKSDGSVIATGPSLATSMMHMGKWIAPQVDDAALGAGIEGPAVLIYMGHMAGHDVDEIALLALVPHHEATHIASRDGAWSSPATWLGGQVPGEGARVLIPHGRSVTYDVGVSPRLDTIRVDGTLSVALDRSTSFFYETMLVTRGAAFNQGTGPQNRLPAQFSCTTTISGRDYRTSPTADSDIDLTRDPRLLGRGLVVQGAWTAWGTRKRSWSYADPVPAGATAITLHDVPTGWQVGDEIVIGGTAMNYRRLAIGGSGLLDIEDETRTITAISGNTVSWSGGLVHDHHHQHPDVTRDDLSPVVMLKGGRNISFTSEVTEAPHRRGHTMVMHEHSACDLWDVQAIGLGRTDKSRPSGVVTGAGLFRYEDDGNGIVEEPLTAFSNLQSRYPFHFHKVGFEHAGPIPAMHDCYMEDTPGWGFVHHECFINFFRCVSHRFYGAGMVSENGSELGGWMNCLSLGTSFDDTALNLQVGPKVLSGPLSNAGDIFRLGIGFGHRGRAMRTNGNVGVSCYVAQLFFHRQDASVTNRVASIVNPSRLHTDLKEVNKIQNGGINLPETDWINVNYPILHIEDNAAIGCMFGLFVSKSNPRQSHDVSIGINGYRSFGCLYQAIHIEYVMTYVLRDIDITAGRYGTYTQGVSMSGNVYQSGIVRGQIEGFDAANGSAVKINNGLDTHPTLSAPSHDSFSQDDPRYFFVGLDAINCTRVLSTDDVPGQLKTVPEVSFIDDDWDNTLLDEGMDPAETLPLVIDTWDGSAIIGQATNADGRKIDNVSALGHIAPKLNGDAMFPTNQFAYRVWRTWEGYWQYGGNDVLRVPYVIADRVTGRPHKLVKLTNVTAARSGTDHGALAYAAAPVAASDIAVPCATNGSVTIDVLAGCTGGGGAGTYALDEGDFIAPNHGMLELDAAAGQVTFTPDPGYTGDDRAYIFVVSQNRFVTRQLRFLVNAGATQAAVETPVAGLHVSAAPHPEPNAIALTLAARPGTDARRIRHVQYQTDDNGTWRRACYHWRKGVAKLTALSDGSPVTSGTHTVKVRYVAAYDDAVSGESANMPVTIA